MQMEHFKVYVIWKHGINNTIEFKSKMDICCFRDLFCDQLQQTSFI